MSSNTWGQQYNAINYAQERRRRECPPSTPPTNKICYDLWFAESGINTKKTGRDGGGELERSISEGQLTLSSLNIQNKGHEDGAPTQEEKTSEEVYKCSDCSDWSDKGGCFGLKWKLDSNQIKTMQVVISIYKNIFKNVSFSILILIHA